MSDHSVPHILIHSTRLADGLSTSSKADHAVLIEDGCIKAVGPRQKVQGQAPPDVEVVDLGDACLTPGLIDSHTHLSLAGDSRSYVEMFSETDDRC